MAGNAKIGALHVSLGLNSAQFETGLKKSQSSLANFGKFAVTAFKGVAIAATAAATAMGFAVKSAIDNADAMSKSAQKAGVTTEALSRLAYAADFSDVSLESLTTGLGKLSKVMAEAAVNKTSTAALAFKALGVSVVDANGKLRGSDVVFAEISDRFARMENGATKTALAMQIFGRAGAEMIPLLNGGSAELKRMADEADRLGITISTKTGKDAERFNDTLALIGKVLQGVVNKVMEAALPALQSLAEVLASPKFAEAASILANNVIGALARIIEKVAEVITWFDEMSRAAATDDAVQRLRDRLTGKTTGTPSARKHSISDFYGPMMEGGQIKLLGKPQGAASGTPTDDPFEPIITGAAKAKEAIEITIPPLNEMQQAVADVGAAFDNAVSSALSGLISDVIKGGNAFDNLISKVGQLGDQLIDMALNSAIQGLFGNLIGGLFGGGGMGLGSGAIGRGTYGGVGGFFPAFPSFDGGGYTGMGARSGGLDGKGGFMAMLHPNETVNDHSKGQSGGLEMNFNITGSRQDAAEIANVARQEAMKVVREYQSNPYRK